MRLISSGWRAEAKGGTYYHCIKEPIKKAQLPQKVASDASYSAPLLPYAGPKAPQSFLNVRVTYQRVIAHRKRTYSKAKGADQIPKPDMPSKDLPSGYIPFRLRLEHVKSSRNYKT